MRRLINFTIKFEAVKSVYWLVVFISVTQYLWRKDFNISD